MTAKQLAYQEPDVPAGPSAKPNGRALRVLVVEDHTDTLASTATLLRLYGHEVHEATDGPSALCVARDSRPDVVLLDIGLPGMDGYELAKRLQEEQQPSGFLGKLLLVAVTGYADEAHRLRSADAGIDLHLVKPVDPDQLRKLLNRLQTILIPGAERTLAERLPN